MINLLRVCTLFNAEHYYVRISKISLISLVFTTSIIICLPSFFIVDFVKLEHDNLWQWKMSEFGKSKYGKIYNIFLLIFEYIIPVTALITLSIVSKVQYGKIISRKHLMKNETEAIKNKKIMFTKMILILTVVFVITRTFYVAGSLMSRLYTSEIIQIDQNSACIYNFILQVSFLQFFTVHAFSEIVYLTMDKNMKEVCITSKAVHYIKSSAIFGGRNP